MKIEANEVEINGIKYIPKGSEQPSIPASDISLVRSETAGVFFGKIDAQCLAEGWVRFKTARRIWYWSGAASLSQLAVEGTTKPKDCKFPTPVENHTVLKVIEIIQCTEKAAKSLNEVLIWRQ